ncbi:MAG TPA: SDR family oxidoreductase [Cyclobacteriaceae bacterium]|nr:SDR family oxidoreductase [Cyclobacteriaceae bacterium]HRJ83408.1 SDR family oxidoreductase [Cyclobacteriaceae bacterium]
MTQLVAIITGAGSGIGLHFAQSLAQQQFKVCLVDVNLESIESLVPASGNVMHRVMDVRSAEAWQNLVNDTAAIFGRIDYLFNFAGIVQPGFIYDADLTLIDKHIDINAKGSMYGTKVVGDYMKRQGSGHIINIASLAGIAPVPGIALYSASKFAIRGFSLAAAMEYKPFGVTVSVVCPDLVKTPMYDLELQYTHETALVFSGNLNALEPADVTREILKLMKSKKREICIPASRGRLAKVAALWPWLADRVRAALTRKGLAQMKKLKGG